MTGCMEDGHMGKMTYRAIKIGLLEYENEQLRELVADMWAYMATPCDDYCDKCLSADRCKGLDECPKRGEYERRMIELGIEVKE